MSRFCGDWDPHGPHTYPDARRANVQWCDGWDGTTWIANYEQAFDPRDVAHDNGIDGEHFARSWAEREHGREDEL